MISAIVTAAGSGRRMQSDVSKQFLKLGSQTLLQQTLDTVLACRCFHRIVLVHPKGQLLEITHPKLVHVEGGPTRQASVYRGLCALSDAQEKVLIHDGVRCLVSAQEIQDVIQACAKPWDGSVLGYPIRDTLKKVQNNTVVTTINREDVWAVQTPQVFFFDQIQAAHKKAINDTFQATDDVQLIERMGGRVRVVEGSIQNIKPTYPSDMKIIQALRVGLDT